MMTSIGKMLIQPPRLFVAAVATALLVSPLQIRLSADEVAPPQKKAGGPQPRPVAAPISEAELLKLQLAGKSEQVAIDLFERSVFGAKGAQATQDAGDRIDRFLQQELKFVDRVCGLDARQQQKLELAGRGDVKQYWERVEVQKQKLVSSLDTPDDIPLFETLSKEMKALQHACRCRPFGAESLFSKTLKNVLTPEQAARLNDQLLSPPESKKKITVENAADLTRIHENRREASGITWNRPGDQIAFTEFNKSVEIYSFPEYKLLRTIGEGRKTIGFDFSPAENVVAIGENSKNAAIIDLRTGNEMLLETGDSQPAVKFSPDGKRLATGGYGTSAKLWSTETGQLQFELDVGVVGGLTPVFSPDGSILAIGNRNSRTHLFDVATGQVRFVLNKASSQELKFDPTGAKLAVVYVDSSIALWDVKTGQMIDHVEYTANELYTLDWTPDGSVLATGGNNASVTLWDANDLSILSELPSPEWVIKVRFSPDGTKLLTAGGARQPGTVRCVETWAVP